MNKENTLALSVIVPVFNDQERLERCMDRLCEQDFDGDYEIIVVDNGSSIPVNVDRFLEQNVLLIQEQTPGSYAARNKAIGIASGNLIGFTDSDCLPAKDWVTQALKVFSEHESVSLVAGNIELFAQSNKAPNPAEAYEICFAFPASEMAQNGEAMTANLFVRREVIRKIGLFNQQAFSGGDVDFTRRATSAGLELMFSPLVNVLHPARSSFSALENKMKRVIGGHWVMSKMESRMKKNFSIIGFAKDFLAIFKKVVILFMSTDSGLPLRHRVKALPVILFIKYVTIREKILLRFFAKEAIDR